MATSFTFRLHKLPLVTAALLLWRSEAGPQVLQAYRDYMDSFPDEAIDLFCARANNMIVPSPSQQVLIPQGGMVACRPSDYPIPWRKAPWCVHPFGRWEDPAHDMLGKRWVHDIRNDLKPWTSGAVYLNFIGDEGDDRIAAGFGSENYEKLAKVKAKYDPENIFRLNHNVKPR